MTTSAEVLTLRLRTAGCVFAEDEARLLIGAAAGNHGRLEALVARRIAGEPLEHLLGWVAFCGHRFTVAPGVFVPRRRTEFLVERAAALTGPGDVLVDLCCGCGAVGAAVALMVGGLRLHAADIDPVAVACARQNLAPLGGAVHCGDLFGPLPAELAGHVNTIVVNAPYVPTAGLALMPAEARDHEPRAALDGGADGLDVHRRIAGRAGRWLAAGGHVVVETSAPQAPGTTAAFTRHGFTVRVDRDERREATAVTATIPRGRLPS